MQSKKKKHIDWLWILLVPLGLVTYMVYLWQTRGDPLAFYHVQPAFGAARSAESLILLPQVIWRYLKIVFLASPYTFPYVISLFELTSFVGSLCLLWIGYKKKVSLSYLFYAGAVMILPTLTGTLSSFPRYLLSAFPLFFIFGMIQSVYVKILLSVIFFLGLVLFCSAFLQGYFVS